MELKVIHATENCADSTCPTIYVNEQGNYVIQGFKLSNESKLGISLPESEDLVEIPREFLQKFLKKANQLD